MLNKKRIFTCILVILTITFGCGEEPTLQPQQNLPEYEGTIVSIGDSLTEGLGVDEEFTYPALLQNKLMQDGWLYKVINAGVSGETSSGALSRIDWALTLNPDIVILVTGANDGLRGIDPQLIRANITKIIHLLKERKIMVVLGGMQMAQNLGQHYTTAFTNVYPEIAKAQDVILMPFFLEGVGGKPDLNQSDGIHPTAEGYRIIVDNVYPYVVQAIQKHQGKD